MCDSQEEVQKVINNLKDKEGFCDYSVKCFHTEVYETNGNNWENGFSENTTTKPTDKSDAKPTRERLPKPEKYVPPTSLKDRISASLNSFEETKAANKEHLDKVLGRNQPVPVVVPQPKAPAEPREIDESMDVPAVVEVGVMEFNEYEYTIDGGELGIKIKDGEIWLSPEICAEYESDEDEDEDFDEDEDEMAVDYAVRSLRFYFNGEFNTKLTDISQLKGKKFICDTEMQPDSDDGAFLYVVEHEEIGEGILEIIDIDDKNVTFRWYGSADVGWNDSFGYGVPFNGTITVPTTIEEE